MASETRTERRNWDRWRGTRADIVGLAERIEDLLEVAGVEKREVRVKVAFENTEVSYESAAEAAEGFPTADLTGLKTISLSNLNAIFDDLAVRVYFFKFGHVLEVEGSGDHHIEVAGIADDVAAVIDRGGHRPSPHRAWIGVVVAVLWAALLVGSVVVSGLLSTILSVLVIVPLVAWLWLFSFPLFIPRREILEEGRRSRGERIRASSLRFAGWVLTLVAGAALGVAFTKWLG